MLNSYLRKKDVLSVHSWHLKGTLTLLTTAGFSTTAFPPFFYYLLAASVRLTSFFSVVLSGEAVRLAEGGESAPLMYEPLPSCGF